LEPRTFSCDLNGKTLTIETGRLAGQADGAVTVRLGDTVVLATVVVAKEAREGTDFLPLTIDYEERLYAAGKIPGGFIRREGRPSEAATLSSRLTDRPLRPLLPKTWRREIQVVITTLSVDQENDPDVLGVIGGSAALCISSMPFEGPVSAVHVGYINDQFVVNPAMKDLESGVLDMVVASTAKAVTMVEAGAKEVSEEIAIKAIQIGHEACQAINKIQEELRAACGKAKQPVPVVETKAGLVELVDRLSGDRISPILMSKTKQERESNLDALVNEIIKQAGEGFTATEIQGAFDDKVKKVLRKSILEKGLRLAGRGTDEIRPLSCDVGLLPRTHGSGLFTRGQTQVLAITTLGSAGEEQKLDGLGIEDTKRFIHHYNFPGFSTGETRRTGNPGRREIGHGALAERSLAPIIPDEKEFPYTIRLVSEVMSSSGSTSMGSVCASTLSMMDAGVPIKSMVAGIAMGLITDYDSDKYVVLTDIEGYEDAYGDMDYKVAGTDKGITALQMDIKLKGVDWAILGQAMQKAKIARNTILGVMRAKISTPRPEMSPYAPRVYKIKINPDKIGAVIGSGGKTIRSIIEQTKATIDIEDDGTVLIGSSEAASALRAIQIIESLTKEIEIGAVYTGKVSRIMNFGAMVEIVPGKDGLIHISELADYRVGKVEDIVKIGDEVTVKVIEIDNMGRINLSRRALLAPSGDAGQPPQDGQGGDRRPYPPRSGGRPPMRDNR